MYFLAPVPVPVIGRPPRQGLCSTYLHLLWHQNIEMGNIPYSYLFLVPFSNGNESDYTSKIDNFTPAN